MAATMDATALLLRPLREWFHKTFLEFDSKLLSPPLSIDWMGMKLPIDQLVLIGCFFSSFIFSSIYYHFMLPDQYFPKTPATTTTASAITSIRKNSLPFYKGLKFRQAYISIIGAMFMGALFSWKAQLHIYFCIAFTYAISFLLISWKGMPLFAFLTLMSILSYTHIIRQFSSFDIGTFTNFAMDHSGTIMMMIIKLCTFPYDIHDSYSLLKGIHSDIKTVDPEDGTTTDSSTSSVTDTKNEGNSLRRSPRKQLENLKKINASKSSPYTLPDPREKALVLEKYPTPLEFLSYALLFPGVLVGPTLNFFEFRQFMSGEMFKPLSFEIPGSGDTLMLISKLKRDRINRFIRVISISLFFCLLHAFFRDRYPIPWLVGAEFISLPIWQRILMTHLTILVERSKYYFVWGISEASYILMGLGFKWNEKDGTIHQNGMENVNPLIIETSYDFRGLINAWNVCTSSWLHTYIYTRIRHKYKKDGSSSRANLLTNLTSAFWHGFYPGYYLMFICAGWLTIVSRLFYKKFTWPFSENSKRIVCYLSIVVMCDYLFVPFMLLNWKESIQYWDSMSYFGHWALLIITILFMASSKFSSSSSKHHHHHKDHHHNEKK